MGKNEFDIPIFKKVYELYKMLHEYRHLVPKNDRHTIWQRTEDTVLTIIEGIFNASQLGKATKLPVLERVSVKVNLLRVFIRLARETKAIVDPRKHMAFEAVIDEIGRMLGGWIKATKV